MHLLDNYTFDARTRYESHTLFYTPENGETVELRGFLAAAIILALAFCIVLIKQSSFWIKRQ